MSQTSRELRDKQTILQYLEAYQEILLEEAEKSGEMIEHVEQLDLETEEGRNAVERIMEQYEFDHSQNFVERAMARAGDAGGD